MRGFLFVTGFVAMCALSLVLVAGREGVFMCGFIIETALVGISILAFPLVIGKVGRLCRDFYLSLV